MSDRRIFFRTFATLFPRSYWMMQSAACYGLVSLVDDLTTSLGWDASFHWAPRILSAIFFGGFMLKMARRETSPLPPTTGPKG